jgi:acetoin utilization deacetylase AcuC-like enzyme
MDDLVFYYSQEHQAHAEKGHPERPERLESIRIALMKAGIWDRYSHLNPSQLSTEVLQTVHESIFLERLHEACSRSQRIDTDTYVTPQSWQLALDTAGGGAALARAVWQSEAKRGFLLARPPGHHATPRQAMGFCLLNNIALAAESLIQKCGAQRLAIIDIDLHHGNGTQEIFWQRGDVFYISTHQHPHYPGTGKLQEIGAGAGTRKTANLPLPPYSGNQAFSAVLEEFIQPLLDRFQPEMLLVSAGFDIHWRDPLGQLLISTEGFANLIAQLTNWSDKYCEGRIALFLEGGYDLEAGAACALASTNALLGLPWEDPLGPSPHLETTDWRVILNQAKQIWEI